MPSKKKKSPVTFWKLAAFGLLAIMLFSQLFDVIIKPKNSIIKLISNTKSTAAPQSTPTVDVNDLQSKVLPAEGIELPITWGDFGKRMIADGVIDEAKFRQFFPNGLDETSEAMLADNYQGKIVMTQQNSQFLLDILWAFGLANRNEILTGGEMTDPKYGGKAGNFASTGGWTLARGNAMSHYSKYAYVTLTNEQQKLVDVVSSGIYRPCCGNSTHFPDCNHGMAMLGLLELMAANGANEEQMYKAALGVNSHWFPQTYIDLATYFAEQGQDWKDVDPKLVLGSEYSSAQGYQATRQKIKSLPQPQQGGSSC